MIVWKTQSEDEEKLQIFNILNTVFYNIRFWEFQHLLCITLDEISDTIV